MAHAAGEVGQPAGGVSVLAECNARRVGGRRRVWEGEWVWEWVRVSASVGERTATAGPAGRAGQRYHAGCS